MKHGKVFIYLQLSVTIPLSYCLWPQLSPLPFIFQDGSPSSTLPAVHTLTVPILIKLKTTLRTLWEKNKESYTPCNNKPNILVPKKETYRCVAYLLFLCFRAL